MQEDQICPAAPISTCIQVKMFTFEGQDIFNHILIPFSAYHIVPDPTCRHDQ